VTPLPRGGHPPAGLVRADPRRWPCSLRSALRRARQRLATREPTDGGFNRDRAAGARPGLRVDSFSLERLILSADAEAAGAEISWAEAAPSINESAALVRALGYGLRFNAVPLCVFTGDNAEHVRANVNATPRDRATQRYLDPYVAAGRPEVAPARRRALPDPCVPCAYRNVCGRVERWYLHRCGVEGLRTGARSVGATIR
jgi:hypothetical protein